MGNTKSEGEMQHYANEVRDLIKKSFEPQLDEARSRLFMTVVRSTAEMAVRWDSEPGESRPFVKGVYSKFFKDQWAIPQVLEALRGNFLKPDEELIGLKIADQTWEFGNYISETRKGVYFPFDELIRQLNETHDSLPPTS